jgi:hypothetical protein
MFTFAADFLIININRHEKVINLHDHDCCDGHDDSKLQQG